MDPQSNFDVQSQIKQALTETDLYRRLGLVATSRLRAYTWRGVRNGNVPEGKEASDFVNDAVRKTLDGTRTWSPVEKDLFDHLSDVIRSDISNLTRKRENRFVVADRGRSLIDVIADVVDDRSSRDLAENRIYISQICIFIRENFPELAHISSAILLKGLVKNQDLAEELKCPVTEIVNMRKRLKRALAEFETGNPVTRGSQL